VKKVFLRSLYHGVSNLPGECLSIVDGRIILRWIFRKLEGVMGTGWSWLSIGTGGGHL
jgi:hypothetical protein